MSIKGKFAKKSTERNSDTTEKKLRCENRELQKTIRQLNQTVGQLEKQIALLEGRSEVKQEKATKTQKSQSGLCQNCGKGEIKTNSYPMGNGNKITITNCTVCDYTERRK